jgi:undecaprenyl-diphosphatase
MFFMWGKAGIISYTIDMEIIIALILGIVEGLTEFIPVSSTGHLIIVGHFLDFTGEKAALFEVVIQSAAMMAAVVIYFEKLVDLIPFYSKKKTGFSQFNGLKLLLITSLPASIVGLVFKDVITEKLFNPISVSIGLIVGGIALILFDKLPNKSTETKNLDSIKPKQALIVGLMQVASLWPGVSRAASTIIGGGIAGMDRKTAVDYSFMAAIPLITAASAVELIRKLDIINAADIPLFITGLVVSFVAGLFAIRFFLKFINKHSLAVFGYYRIILAIVVLLVLS